MAKKSNVAVFFVLLTSTAFAHEPPRTLAQLMHPDFSHEQTECGAMGELIKDANDYVRNVSMRDNYISWYKNNRPHECWIDDVLSDETFLSDEYEEIPVSHIPHFYGDKKGKPYETFFIEKRVLPSDALIVVVGDIHGNSIDSMIRFLQEIEVFDEDYRLYNPEKTFFVFLGDYVDKGALGLRTLSSILKLYNQAPLNVFPLRGNHDLPFVSRYFHKIPVTRRRPDNFYEMFVKEMEKDYVYQEICPRGSFHTSFIDCLENFSGFFQAHMPTAAFLGCKADDGKTNYILFCHGGPEVGHNPYPFLASQANMEKIDSVDRRPFMQTYKPKDLFLPLVENVGKYRKVMKKIDTDLEGMIPIFRAQYDWPGRCPTVYNFSNNYWGKKLYIGYLWNRVFTEEGFAEDHQSYFLPHLLSLVLSRRQVEEWLTNPYSQVESHPFAQNQIVSMFTGHQHKDEGLSKVFMATQLMKNNLYVRQWDGTVNTLLQTTNIIKGYDDVKKESFAVIKLAPKKEDWAVAHYAKIGDGEYELQKATSGKLFAPTGG